MASFLQRLAQVVLLCVPSLLAQIQSSTLRGYRGCPADELQGRRWAESIEGQLCTTYIALLDNKTGLQSCDYTRFLTQYRAVSDTPVYNASHAAALAALLPSGASARVSLLAVDNGTSVSWEWTGGLGSTWAITDGTAWVGSAVPAPAIGLCVHLLPSGLLQALSCDGPNYKDEGLLCSMPSCTCDGDFCETTTENHVWSGFDCTGAPDPTFITGLLILPATLPLQQRITGCGTSSNSSLPPSAFKNLMLLPGDTLRICGSFIKNSRIGSNLRSMYMLGPTSIAVKASTCSALPDTVCQEFVFAPALSISARSNVLTSASRSSCVLVSSPVNAIRCWQESGETEPFVDKVTSPESWQGPYIAHTAGRFGYCSVEPRVDLYDDIWRGKAGCEFGIDVPEEEDVVAVAISGEGGVTASFCALTRTGRVFCWGEDGFATELTRVPDSLPPSLAIAAGKTHVCAIAQGSGRVQCWGDCDKQVCEPPEDLPPADSISAGDLHTCVIARGSGTVHCWGSNLRGQISTPSLLEPAAEISVFEDRSCAVLAGSGKVVCWGHGYSAPALPQGPPGLPPVLQLSHSHFMTCVVTEAMPGVTCWSDTEQGSPVIPGDLGRVLQVVSSSTVVCVLLPTRAVQCIGGYEFTLENRPPADLPPVERLVPERAGMCAITIGGDVRCWGSIRDAPRDLQLPVADIVINFDTVCALSVTGTVRCWESPLGASDTDFVTPPALPPAARIDSCVSLTCALSRGAGAVTCWGDDTLLAAYPVPADLPPAALLAVGEKHVCVVLNATGQVQCWGERIGVAPAGIAGAVVQLTAGKGHSCALLKNSTVSCWGDNSEGSAMPPTALSGVQEIQTRGYSTCALLQPGGRVHCWGGYFYIRPDRASLLPSDLPPMETVAVGFRHTCAVTRDNGSVRCWMDGIQSIYSFENIIVGSPQSMAPAVLARDPFYGNFEYASVGPSFSLQSQVRFDTTGVRWTVNAAESGEDIILDRLPAFGALNSSSGLVSAPSGIFTSARGLAVPEVLLYVQPDAQSAPQAVPCVHLLPDEGYNLRCTGSSYVYGVGLRLWNGSALVSRGFGRPSPVDLRQVTVEPDPFSVRLARPLVTTSEIAMQIHEVRDLPGADPTVITVIAGDVVTLLGSGFGMNARLAPATPWWAGTSSSLRSCIHLSWWASIASYHGDDCVCNGLEDWLGEGELPVSHILAWNDTFITFVAPNGEGVREIRPCVQGHGLNWSKYPPGGERSVFLVYPPPHLASITPNFIDSTDSNTTVLMEVVFKADQDFAVAEHWGSCDAGPFYTLPVGGSNRSMLVSPLPAEQYVSRIRRCTSLVFFDDTAQGSRRRACHYWGTALDLLPLWRGAGAATPPTACSVFDDPYFYQGTETACVDGVCVSTGELPTLRIQYPRAIPNAPVSVTLRVSVWDGGLLLVDELVLVSTVDRTNPTLQAVAPNPLVLDASQETVLLTLFGKGYRTSDEVRDPWNGLDTYNAQAAVWVDDVPCPNVSVTRTVPSGFAFVTCLYPAALLGGGEHSVTLEMIGQRTTLGSRQGSTAALVSACAEGTYGMFGVEGHNLCLQCPAGASCPRGVGVAPIAREGHYNLALPNRNASGSKSLYDQLEDVLPVSALAGGALCPNENALQAFAGRHIACVLPCDPAESCLEGNLCAEGYVSQPPTYRCSMCSAGFYRVSGVCARCPPLRVLSILLVLLAAAASAGITYILSLNDMHLGALNIVVEYVQIVSLLQGPSLPWPSAVAETLKALSILRVNVEVSAPECYTNISISPEYKVWTVVCMPAVIVLLGLAAHLGLALYRCAVGRGARHSFSPAVARVSFKLMGALYLPVVQACLEAWNCTLTDPPEPGDAQYLSIAFEQCGTAGGLQARLIPVSLAGLLLFGAGYPLTIAWLLRKHNEQIVEDQLLLAAGIGDTPASNPRAYLLRQYLAAVYQDFKPGHHYAALLHLCRRALVCICALMLNKSPVLLSNAIVFVMVCSCVVHMSTRPLMTPVTGSAAVLAAFAAQARVGKDRQNARLVSHLQDICKRTQSRPLQELLSGAVVCSDMQAATSSWWSPIVDWNVLEAELQLQIILVGLLSSMYNAALGSVYASTAAPAISFLFFTLLLLAAAHIGITVGYDTARQLYRVLQRLLFEAERDEQPAASGKGAVSVADAPVEEERSGRFPLEVEDVVVPLPWHSMLAVCCCRCWYTRERVRALVTSRQAENAASIHQVAAPVSEWTANPLDIGGAQQQGARQAHGTTDAAPATAGRRSMVKYAWEGGSTQPPGVRADSWRWACAQPGHTHANAPVAAGSDKPGAAGTTLRALRLIGAESGRVSRLPAMQALHDGVRVGYEDVAALEGLPCEDDWRVIRASYLALWEVAAKHAPVDLPSKQ